MALSSHELSKGLDRIGVSLSAGQQQSLLDFGSLLLRWNKSFNLIGSGTEEAMISRHLLDSLMALPFLTDDSLIEAGAQARDLSNERWIDVGTGAGLPGIPLAIALPQLHVTLLDSNSKKTRFMLQVCAELGLNNTGVVHSRVEQYQPEKRYDRVISRAWTSMAKGLKLSQHLCKEQGRLCFLKGQKLDQELREVDKTFTLIRCEALPDPVEARHLFEFTQ